MDLLPFSSSFGAPPLTEDGSHPWALPSPAMPNPSVSHPPHCPRSWWPHLSFFVPTQLWEWKLLSATPNVSDSGPPFALPASSTWVTNSLNPLFLKCLVWFPFSYGTVIDKGWVFGSVQGPRARERLQSRWGDKWGPREEPLGGGASQHVECHKSRIWGMYSTKQLQERRRKKGLASVT